MRDILGLIAAIPFWFTSLIYLFIPKNNDKFKDINEALQQIAQGFFFLLVLFGIIFGALEVVGIYL
jgi:hypothetical protein